MTGPSKSELSRRDLLRHAAIAAAAVASGSLRESQAQAPAGNASPFIPGFRTFHFQTSGATLNGVIGGQGPPLLLLHGAPQSHITWRLIAPDLAKTYTVVAPDLRGYGDSSKPADKPDHSPYSKRAMALDQIELMKSFGFESFRLVGQDRGDASLIASCSTTRKRLPSWPYSTSCPRIISTHT